MSISFQYILCVRIWKTSRVLSCPLTSESHTCPIFWEIDVQEKCREIIFPVTIMHHESTIITTHYELFIFWERFNIFFDLRFVFCHFSTCIRPSSNPFRITPRISQLQKSNRSLFVIRVFKFNDIFKTVSMIINETRWFSINNLWTTFLSFDTATKKTAIILSFPEECPETFFSSIVVNLFMREASCLFISNEDLFWLVSC